MLVFLDFEASSLGKRSYPIEVAWVFEDGRSEAHLIRPAPAWTDWDGAAEALHGISLADLHNHGEPHDLVAQRMVSRLSGHALFASAPTWDGKWMSALLHAAGLPRHSLRLRDSDDARRECAITILAHTMSPELLDQIVDDIIAVADLRGLEPVHRALADADGERQRWLSVRRAARALTQQ
jgi:hypothetical protein